MRSRSGFAKSGSLVAVLSGMFVGSCAPTRPDGSCPTAHVRGELRAYQDLPVMGGFVQYFGAEKDGVRPIVSRCSATFEFITRENSRWVRAWTGRHCGSERFSDATGAELLVYLSPTRADGFRFIPGYEKVEVEDELIARRSALRSDLSGLDPESAQIMDAAFQFEHEELSDRGIAGCIDEQAIDEQKSADKASHSVCTTWRDLAIYEYRVTGPLSHYLQMRMDRHTSDLSAARQKHALDLGERDRAALDMAGWTAEAINLQERRRLRHFARAADLMTKACAAAVSAAPDQGQSATGNGLLWCQTPGRFWELAERHLRAGPSDLRKEALASGFIDAQGTLRGASGAGQGSAPTTLTQLMTQKEFEVLESVKRRWKRFGQALADTPNVLYANMNVTSAENGLGAGLYTVPVQRIVRNGLAVSHASADDTVSMKSTLLGLQITAERQNLQVEFQKGDSGTTFSILGLWPVLALNGVDGEQSSGGASVVPLPEPRSSSGSADGLRARGDLDGIPGEETSDTGQPAENPDCL